MQRVVILGAGVTGLAAADRLTELGGGEVTVVEAEPHVGGLASTIRRGDAATDLGPHRLHTEIDEVQKLLTEIAGDRLIRIRRSSRMYLAGQWIPYPLKARAVLRTLGLGKVIQIGAGLTAARMKSLILGRSEKSFEDAMKSAFGAAAYRLVFANYARKVWRVCPEQLSAQIARVRLPDRGILAAFGGLLPRKIRPGRGPVREFRYIRGGIGGLCEMLAERIEQKGGRVILNSRVGELRFGPDGVNAVELRGQDGNVSLPCNSLISTIPLPEFAGMVPGGNAEIRTALSRLEYLSIVLVTLVARKDRIGPDHWLYFPEEPPLTTRASEPRNFDPSIMPAGQSCLCCEVTCRRDEPIYQSDDARIADRIRREIESTGLINAGDIQDSFVIRKDWAYPIYMLEFEKELETVWPFLARIPNMITTGRQGLFNHNNIDHCMVMGRRAAEAVASNPEPARRWYENLDQFNRFRIYD